MTELAALEHFLATPESAPACPREADFKAAWHARGLASRPPVDQAIAGALAADRLAWVFAAGYQATLRNAFGAWLPAQGWAAFAATEDAQDPAAHPGTTLTPTAGSLRLDGCKSWVGHSRVVDHLVVSVNDPAGDKRRARAVVVAANAPGVALSHRERASFLPDLSQGYARFTGVAVAPAAVLEFEPIRQFGRTEAKFVMLAATAFMRARLADDSPWADRGLALAAALVALLGEEHTSRQVYGAIEREFQACADAFEATANTDAIPGYATDARMLRMYSARIQRRVGYARAEVAAGGGE